MVIFLLKYWKQLAGALCLIIVLSLAYNKVYNIGYDAANEECKEKISAYENKLNNKIQQLEATSNQLVLSTVTSDAQRKKDFNNILNSIKNKPLYVIEQDTCKPTEAYIKAYNDAVIRANNNE